MNEVITIRPPTLDDLETVARLIAACDEELTGESDLEHERATVRSDWQSEEVDLAEDVWLAADAAGEIVGYEIVYELGSSEAAACDGYVHPAHVGRGIGTRLLRLALERVARERARRSDAPPRLRATIYSHEERTHELLRAERFAVVRHHWQMRIALGEAPAPPNWPEGIVVRPMRPGVDEHAVYEAVEEAFGDHWGHTPRSFAEWRQLMIEHDDFDPALWQVAWDGERVAGAALCTYRYGIGWIRNLGVRRPYRRRGLGMALLQHAFGMFYRLGTREVGLGVDAGSPTGATRLYERAGMQVERRADTYERTVDATA
jgi:mycothiol synthase